MKVNKNMRTDNIYTSMLQKEQYCNNFLKDNSHLSAWTWISEPEIQYKGVDLSCQNTRNIDIYCDLKLKNSSTLNSTSNYWSVEILKGCYGKILDGWFIDNKIITNLYIFEEGYGKNWKDLDKIDLTIFEKLRLKEKIEKETNFTMCEIKKLAIQMLNSGNVRTYLSNNLYLKLSAPDGNNRPVVNLVFHKNFLQDISKVKKITKINKKD